AKRRSRPLYALVSVLIHRRHGSPFGRATEGRRYGRGHREIQPKRRLMGQAALDRWSKRRLQIWNGSDRGPFWSRTRRMPPTAGLAPHHLGASTITTWRPSKRGSCSTLATLEVSPLTRLRSW